MKPRDPIPMTAPDAAQWQSEYEAWAQEQDLIDAINERLSEADDESF